MAEIHFRYTFVSRWDCSACPRSREAAKLVEECFCAVRLNKMLKKLAGLSDCLKKYASLISRAQKENEPNEIEGHADLYEPCSIQGKRRVPWRQIDSRCACSQNDLSRCSHPARFQTFRCWGFVQRTGRCFAHAWSEGDIWICQGPVSVFNAKTELSKPRNVELIRSPLCPGFGFSVKSDCPVVISSVDPGGLASVRVLDSRHYPAWWSGEHSSDARRAGGRRADARGWRRLSLGVARPRRAADSARRRPAAPDAGLGGDAPGGAAGRWRRCGRNLLALQQLAQLGAQRAPAQLAFHHPALLLPRVSFTTRTYFIFPRLYSFEKHLLKVLISTKESKPKSTCQSFRSKETQVAEKVADASDVKVPPTKASSPWRVRSFLSLKKNKSETKMYDIKYRIWFRCIPFSFFVTIARESCFMLCCVYMYNFLQNFGFCCKHILVSGCKKVKAYQQKPFSQNLQY